MERKNTMLLTVIAVATLLVAVVGATFAYYSVQSGVNNSTTAINTTTGKAATVTYTAGEDQLYLNVTAAQMAKTNEGHVLYAQDTDDPASDNVATDFVLGTFTVTGAEATDIHECTFTYTITTAGTLKDLANNTTNGRIALSTGTTDTGTITGLPATTAFSTTAATGSGKFRAVGNKTSTIHGTASITNTTAVQNETNNDISDLSGIVTSVRITDVVCEAVAS